jgi:thiol-disulfide isomerase/thioredoxin
MGGFATVGFLRGSVDTIVALRSFVTEGVPIMPKSMMISAAVAVAVVAAAAISLTAQAASDPESLKGKPAPAIALKTLDGNDVLLAGMKGKVVLVDTWATWCPPCRASLPHIQKLATDKTLAEKGLVVWAVNDKETKADVSKYMTDNKYTFTVPMDEKGEVLKAYFITGIPTTIVVGRDGTVKDAFVGYGGDASAKKIDDAVAKALAEPAPK